MLRVAVVLCAVVALAAASMTWQSCNNNVICKPYNVVMSPDPAPRGGSATFDIYCTASTQTTGGKISIDVSLNGKHVKTETSDFCQVTSCPAPVGNRTVVHKEDIPSLAPRGGHVKTVTTGTDQTGAALICVEIDFQIG